jgi:hypothetical protein
MDVVVDDERLARFGRERFSQESYPAEYLKFGITSILVGSCRIDFGSIERKLVDILITDVICGDGKREFDVDFVVIRVDDKLAIPVCKRLFVPLNSTASDGATIGIQWLIDGKNWIRCAGNPERNRSTQDKDQGLSEDEETSFNNRHTTPISRRKRCDGNNSLRMFWIRT